MEFTPEKFNKVKNEAEIFYHQIQRVHCPYFREDVNFNSKGWDHLIFKSWNKTRSLVDQYVRLRHIKLAPEVIRSSRTLQGLWTTNKMERVRKKNGNWKTVLKLVTYYEFIAVMASHGSRVRVKVIVKQIDGGEKHFFSIIPYWGTTNSGDRLLYSGNPEAD